MSPLELALMGAAFFVAQTVKGVTGFGAGLLTLPVLLALLPPDQAILLLVSVDLVTSAWLVKDVFRGIARRLVAAMLMTVFIGQWIGTEILFAVDPDRIARLLGIVVLFMGARFAWRPVVSGRGEMRVLPSKHTGILSQGALAGLVSGLMRGTVGAGGPPLVVFVRHHFIDAFARAHLLVVMFFGGIAMLGLLLAKGADPNVLRWSPLMLLPGLVGSRVGAWLATRASRKLFGRMTGIILVIAGIALLLS